MTLERALGYINNYFQVCSFATIFATLNLLS